MNEGRLTETLSKIREDVASIKKEQENTNKRLDELAKQQDKIDDLEKDNSSNKTSIKFLWICVSAEAVFFLGDVVAPIIVNWLSRR